MTHQAKPETVSIQLPPEMMAAAAQRAKALGMTMSEYITHILNDELADPWRQPLPPDVEAQYEEEYQAFLAEEKQGKHKTYYSAAEYIRDNVS